MLGPGLRSHPIDLFFNSKDILPHLHAKETHFAPIFTPTVTNNPVGHLFFFIEAPANNANFVCNLSSGVFISKDSALVVQNRLTVDASDNRASMENLSLHFEDPLDLTIFSYFHFGVLVQSHTLTTFSAVSITCAANVLGLTSVILGKLAAMAFNGIGRASLVNLTGFERNPARSGNPGECGKAGAAVARACDFTAAIQNILDGNMDFGAFVTALNLDAVCQGRHRAVCPARSAVLGDVLVEDTGEIRDAVNVAPRKGERQVFGTGVIVRLWVL